MQSVSQTFAVRAKSRHSSLLHTQGTHMASRNRYPNPSAYPLYGRAPSPCSLIALPHRGTVLRTTARALVTIVTAGTAMAVLRAAFSAAVDVHVGC